MLTPKEFPPRQQLSTVKEGIPAVTYKRCQLCFPVWLLSSFGVRSHFSSGQLFRQVQISYKTLP